jgi:biopolymer transport protein ExbB
MTELLPSLLALATSEGPERRGPLQLLMSSGFIGPLLALAGCLALAMVVARWLELRTARLAPEALQRSLEVALRGAEPLLGLDQAVRSRTLLGELVAAGLHLRRAGLDEMLANIERAAARETLRLGNRLANLARLGGIALLLGLFGTTLSLMSLLEVLGNLEEPTLSDFAAGSYEALVCLGLGLLVAMLCFVAFFWLDSRLTQRTLTVRDLAEEFVREAAERGT